ncbi:hypothetical protein FKM82_009848 [Ascaphus truei]
MSEGDAREDACRDYQSSLEDLTFNSKPHINMLTILAEENVQFAKDIVIIIEAQIAKAPTTEKLPVMYLMDSIVKNVGREYLAAFAKNLVSTFIIVFEKVDENTRKSLFKLRSTWDDIFPSKKMFALDVKVNTIDPAWPVKPLPPNVNTSSIHVNPKFLSKSEEPPSPANPVPSPVPPPINNPDVQKGVSQEQLIRQQLLVKQKQLLELQQKKLELELEQTKAQLAGHGHGSSSIGSGSIPPKPQATQAIPHMPVKAPHATSIHPEKNRVLLSSQPHDRPQVPTRDPRLNRECQQTSHAKDQGHKKDLKSSPFDCKSSKPVSNEKSNSTKQEKAKSSEKLPKRESVQTELKGKSKSPSPLKIKLPHAKENKSKDSESIRDLDVGRRDPRLRKHLPDKADDDKEAAKERRKSTEKKEEHKSLEHRPTGSRNKVVNGTVQKIDTNVNDSDKPTAKPGRSSSRKRSRSPKSRSPAHSPKRRERRSPPKRRQRSISPIPSLLKIGKLRQPAGKLAHVDEFPSNTREERNKRNQKLETRDRRQKKTPEERPPDTQVQISTKSISEPKENVENWQGSKASKRWKSSWEENKNLQNDDHRQGGNRTPHPRHRDSWQNNKGVLSPRTPKQQPWLSVDANLQIPKELTSASKGELLKKANERLASGEITQDEFLVVAHQIRQLFQYQEEKHRCNVWDSPTEENTSGLRKTPLLSNAELTYYQHKAKLKRTQVQHAFSRGELFDSDEFLDLQLDEMVLSGRESELNKSKHGGKIAGSPSENELFPERSRRHSPITGTRPHADDLSHEIHRRPDEQREPSKGVREEQRPPFSERFPHKRPKYEDSEQASYGESPDSRLIGKDSNLKFGALLEEIRPLFDGPPRLSGTRADGSAGKGFEEPSSVSNIREESPVKACLRFDGAPGNQVRAQRFDAIPGQPVDPHHFETIAGKPVDGPRFEGVTGQPVGMQCQSLGMQRFEGTPSQIVATSQPVGLQRLDAQGQPLGTLRFEGSQGQQLGPQRFEGAAGQPMIPQRFEGVQQLGPQRFEGGMGPQRFDGSPRPPLLAQRFEGVQCQPMRLEQSIGQPMRFDGLSGQPMGSMRFEGPLGPRFELNQAPRFDSVPGPQPLMRFDGPIRQVGPRFEGTPVNRFDGQPSLLPRFNVLPGQPCQRFEGPPGHQTPPRFDGQLQVQPRFDSPLQHRFDVPNQQPRFEMPLGLQGPRFENVNNHPAVRQDPYGQAGPYSDHPNMFHGQTQGMPFQRPEQRFDITQGPSFGGPSGPGVQCFPNQPPRPSGPYFDDKNPHGPQFRNFNNLPVGNLQSNQPVRKMNVCVYV